MTPFAPGVLTGWVRWASTVPPPRVDVALLIDVYAQAGPTEYFGTVSIPGATLTVSLNANPDPALFDLILTYKSTIYQDDDSWHNIQRPARPHDFDTGVLEHVYIPGTDFNQLLLSL